MLPNDYVQEISYFKVPTFIKVTLVSKICRDAVSTANRKGANAECSCRNIFRYRSVFLNLRYVFIRTFISIMNFEILGHNKSKLRISNNLEYNKNKLR